MGYHIWHSKEATGWGTKLLILILFTVPNATSYPSRSSVLIVKLYRA